jgi:hypothetical protein
MYINKDIGWVAISSAAAAKNVCNILDLHTPVNYILASKPLIDGLIEAFAPVIAICATFSQGRIRCHFRNEVDKQGVEWLLFQVARAKKRYTLLRHPLVCLH